MMIGRTILFVFLSSFIAGCGADAPREDEAGSPATTGRTATAPRPEDIATTSAIADQQVAGAGQALFIEKNCTMCHSVTSAGVKGMSDAGPDLAGVGSRRGGAAGVEAFLRSADHPKTWEGTDAELTAIATWLANPAP
jgi:cytochrome c2